MKKFQLLFSLVAIILVLWFAVLPIDANSNSNSLIGAWIPGDAGGCCNTGYYVPCSDGQTADGISANCAGDETEVCAENSSSAWGTCKLLSTASCYSSIDTEVEYMYVCATSDTGCYQN